MLLCVIDLIGIVCVLKKGNKCIPPTFFQKWLRYLILPGTRSSSLCFRVFVHEKEKENGGKNIQFRTHFCSTYFELESSQLARPILLLKAFFNGFQFHCILKSSEQSPAGWKSARN
jgi:hypothetical protein